MLELDALLKAVNKANVKPYDFHPVGETTSTLTDEEHKANIRKCIQHCLRGDVFQIVVSRRFVQNYEGMTSNSTVRLRSINPSPYLFYFDFGGFRIFGSSPETHNRIVGRRRSLILLPERPDEQVIWNRIERLQNFCVMTRRRMQNM